MSSFIYKKVLGSNMLSLYQEIRDSQNIIKMTFFRIK